MCFKVLIISRLFSGKEKWIWNRRISLTCMIPQCNKKKWSCLKKIFILVLMKYFKNMKKLLFRNFVCSRYSGPLWIAYRNNWNKIAINLRFIVLIWDYIVGFKKIIFNQISYLDWRKMIDIKNILKLHTKVINKQKLIHDSSYKIKA